MTTLHHVGLSGGKDSTALWGWILNVATIDDVVAWSMTAHGAKRLLTEEELQAEGEQIDDFDGGLSCKSAMGHCE